MNTILKILSILFVLILLIVGSLYFLLLGKPKDLGMKYSEAAFNEGLEIAQVELKELSTNDPEIIKYEGTHEVKATFSDEMLTSHAYNKDWVGYPISDVQVRVNDDGTCEVSGMLDIATFREYAVSLGVSGADYDKAVKIAELPISKLPFYAKGDGTASNNALNARVTNFEVGRVAVPQDILDQYNPQIQEFGNMVMRSIPGFSVNEARFENGGIYFDGTLPDVEYTKRR